jgi:hypothetical protein
MRRPNSRLHLIVLSVLALQTANTARLTAQTPDDAFLDANAREMVNDARIRRRTFDRSIDEYRTLSTERLSIGHRLLGRDRLLWRRETASRIHWTRTGTIDIDVVGAREIVPVAIPKEQIPEDLSSFMPHIAFDPTDAQFLVRFDSTSIIHPLTAEGELNYRFRSGDSSSIRLPDGKTIRLRELEFIPRRKDPHLIAGSFWIDMDSHAVVQAVFRLARQFVFNSDGDKGDRPPGWFPTMSVDLTHLAVDYGLYDLHWWLPRYVIAQGVLHLGPLGTMPMNYERTYTDYEVTGNPDAPRLPRDSASLRACTPRTSINISVHTGDGGGMERRAERSAEAEPGAGKAPNCIQREYHVTQAPDSVLLNGTYLPGSIYAGETLLSQSELDDIAKRIGDLPDVPWVVGTPHVALGFGGPGLVRYNRIEGVSVGARGEVDLGRAAALGEVRYGFADREVSAELALQRDAATRTYRLGGYHRLVPTDQELRPFTLPSSLGSVLLGVDDAKFFRATGAELVVAPAQALPQWYSLRAYHEKQEDVDVNTDFSLRHAIDKDYVFTRNIEADAATQSGAELTLRHDFGMNPSGLRAGLEVGARGETGTFQFVRPSATVRLGSPFPLGLAAAVEGAAGTSAGDVPVQSNWFMGGATTVRGYPVGAMSGNAFWRARGELATRLPIARLAVFSDMAWAGSREDFASSRPLMSVGAGVSFMDGIVRFDVAHALRDSRDWRVYLYMGGII